MVDDVKKERNSSVISNTQIPVNQNFKKIGFFKRNLVWVILMIVPFLVAGLFFILFILASSKVISINSNFLRNLTARFLIGGLLLIPFLFSLKFLIKGIKNKDTLSWINNLDFLILEGIVMIILFLEIVKKTTWGRELLVYGNSLNGIIDILPILGIFALFTWPILFIFNFIHKAKTGIINKKWFWPIIIFGSLLVLGLITLILAAIASGFN